MEKLKIMGMTMQGAAENEVVERIWQDTHERNSDRIMDLCLSLKGFYLKSGQFLATRHDFMPEPYTVRNR